MEPVEPVAVITLRATKTKRRERKKVVWTEDTVDNENMNKKKSKCCCIYEKPHKFDESDSEDSDDECEHCFGHVERRRRPTPAANVAQVTPEPPVALPLQPVEPTPAPPDLPPQLPPAS
ncbi:hypothetical protein ACJJTC_002758 [Scirpophaga incertulas]